MTAYRRYYESWEEAAERIASERDELRARLAQTSEWHHRAEQGWADEHARAEQALGGASGASSTAAAPHDNGESPVDDPECGTDIGPHHGVLASDEFQSRLAEIYDARVTGRSAEAFGALLAHDRLLRAEVSGGTSTGSARPEPDPYSESALKWSARLRAQQQESRAIEAEERVVLLEEALRAAEAFVAASYEWTRTMDDESYMKARQPPHAAGGGSRAVIRLLRFYRSWTRQRCPVCGHSVPVRELVAHIGWHRRATPVLYSRFLRETLVGTNQEGRR